MNLRELLWEITGVNEKTLEIENKISTLKDIVILENNYNEIVVTSKQGPLELLLKRIKKTLKNENVDIIVKDNAIFIES